MPLVQQEKEQLDLTQLRWWTMLAHVVDHCMHARREEVNVVNDAARVGLDGPLHTCRNMSLARGSPSLPE